MDEFDGSDGGGTTGLIESLASNATQAYETTQALNANPLNTALIYGGTAQTQQGYAGGYASAASMTPTVPGSGWILLLLAVGFGIYALTR